MSEATEKDEKTTDSGPGIFTMFAVGVASAFAVHFIIKGIERPKLVAAAPERDDWDFGA